MTTSQATQPTGTRIFGIRVTLDPKIIVGVLVVIAGLLFWYNSISEDVPASSAGPASVASQSAPSSFATTRPVALRRSSAVASDRKTLGVRPIDATRGDIDPTLRLDLLRRLSAVQPTPATRSLFETGVLNPASNPLLTAKIKGPILPVKPLPPLSSQPSSFGGSITTALNIPFKYYGFVKPLVPNAINRGLFLDGDNVLIGAEGEMVKGYMVVELTPNSARLEDVRLKQGQTLPVVPVATQ